MFFPALERMLLFCLTPALLLTETLITISTVGPPTCLCYWRDVHLHEALASITTTDCVLQTNQRCCIHLRINKRTWLHVCQKYNMPFICQTTSRVLLDDDHLYCACPFKQLLVQSTLYPSPELICGNSWPALSVLWMKRHLYTSKDSLSVCPWHHNMSAFIGTEENMFNNNR